MLRAFITFSNYKINSNNIIITITEKSAYFLYVGYEAKLPSLFFVFLKFWLLFFLLVTLLGGQRCAGKEQRTTKKKVYTAIFPLY